MLIPSPVSDNDVKLGRIVRNGLLAAGLGALVIMSSCTVAGWHYDYLQAQLDQTWYLATRPW